MEFGLESFSWGMGLVLSGWVTGMAIGYIFKIGRVLV